MQQTQLDSLLDSQQVSMITVGVLTALAFLLRFYKINHPDQVVYVPRIYSRRVFNTCHAFQIR